LKVLRVEDEAKYLVNIGRTQIANAIRDAENAENQANQEVAQEEATAHQLAEVAQKQAEIGVAQKRNQLRALVGPARGRGAVGRARGRGRRRAGRAPRRSRSCRACARTSRPSGSTPRSSCPPRPSAPPPSSSRGEAAPRREQGAANAVVMKAMSDALTAAGPQAREMFVLSQLDTLVAQVAAKVKTVQVGAIQIVDAGDGKAIPALAPATRPPWHGHAHARGADRRQRVGDAERPPRCNGGVR